MLCNGHIQKFTAHEHVLHHPAAICSIRAQLIVIHCRHHRCRWQAVRGRQQLLCLVCVISHTSAQSPLKCLHAVSRRAPILPRFLASILSAQGSLSLDPCWLAGTAKATSKPCMSGLLAAFGTNLMSLLLALNCEGLQVLPE